MSGINNIDPRNPNADSSYIPPSGNLPPPAADTFSPQTDTPVQGKGKEAIETDLEKIFNQNPDLKKTFDKLAALVAQPDTGEKDLFSMMELIQCLIDLGQALQQAAVVYADSLNIVTTTMNMYSKQMTQIPVVLEGDVKGDSEFRKNLNAKFANMLEAVRANKGIEEDKAKKIQTYMQSTKDANQSTNDFIGSFLDLLRGISQKIMR